VSGTIRRAVRADLERVLDLALAFYAEDGFTSPAAALRTNLDRLADSPAARVAVHELGSGGIDAFAITTTSFGLENGLIAELEDLYVDPSSRRAGVAERLIEDSAQWAQELGCGVLELTIAPNDLPASAVAQLLEYYRARGFVDVGRRLIHRNLAGVPR
jgi:aminoglycoside 6'-N-acetyltransferase I